MDTAKINEILKFWFEETTPEQHFKKDDAFDALIKEKFLDVYWAIMNGETTDWNETPGGRLAQIIALDQFARNMFRDDLQAFAGDELALKIAKGGIERGDDQKLSKEQQVFMYMPYMHSESKEVHEVAMELFKGHPENLKYEIKHKEIIDRFGRYPHRNKVLGRESTPEEIEFLKENPGF